MKNYFLLIILFFGTVTFCGEDPAPLLPMPPVNQAINMRNRIKLIVITFASNWIKALISCQELYQGLYRFSLLTGIAGAVTGDGPAALKIAGIYVGVIAFLRATGRALTTVQNMPLLPVQQPIVPQQQIALAPPWAQFAG